MSLATFKKKTISSKSSATKRSGKGPGGYWLPQGPFGRPHTLNSVMLAENLKNFGPSGFSLNGTQRSISVGKDMKNSKQGTPFTGIYPRGHGGRFGRYVKSEPVMNAGVGSIMVQGNQWEFVKPSVLSTRGMLHDRFKWAYSGQYPNNWVQPMYTGNQTDSASQGLYVHDKSAANDCTYDVNNVSNYVTYFKNSGPMGCQMTPARGYTMGMMQSNAPYTKTLYRPKDSSAYTLRVQRQCQNPTGHQKPFPYAVQNGTGILKGGINVSNVGNSCNVTRTYEKTPPAWYWETPPGQRDNPGQGDNGNNPQEPVIPLINNFQQA